MRLAHATRGPHKRPGKILVIFCLVVPALLGMIGLVIDSGLAMSEHRETQNAADAGALAAAQNLYQGGSSSTAIAAARDFVRRQTGFSGLTDAQIVVNIPPATGPYTGNNKFAEVIVAAPVNTTFIQIVGIGASQTVRARAVAGYETGGKSEGAIVLDPRGDNFSGLSVVGGAILNVGGSIIVNSKGKGIDQFGGDVPSIYNQYGVATGNNGRIYTDLLRVSGGVDVLQNIYSRLDYPVHMADGSITAQDTARVTNHPLKARRPVGPDPLASLDILPVPQVSTPGVVRDGGGTVVSTKPGTTRGYNVSGGETRTFSPGVYGDITIGGGDVTFEPGIYILSPEQPNDGLKVTGSPTISGSGAMFYFTGSNYLDTDPPGGYDVQDGSTEQSTLEAGPTNPPDPQFNQVNFAKLNMTTTGGSVTLTGYDDASSPFDEVLFYFRRRNGATSNTSVASITGNPGAQVSLTGVIYTKWGNFSLSGGATYAAQFLVGSMSVSGQAVVTILGTGKDFGLADLVYLVE